MATIITMVLAKEREDECEFLEGESVFDGHGELLGWLGQVMDDYGHPCEFMGVGDLGYMSCHGATEAVKLRDLCASLYARLKAASEATDEDWIDARLTKRMQELGILDSTTGEVDS